MKNLTFAMAVVGLSFYFAPSTALAQDSQGNECIGGAECGFPDQSGGGCGCGCGCSVLVAQTNRGVTYSFADDFDGDGIEDEFDNCPFAPNFEQVDSDGDQVGDSCDVCVQLGDQDQADMDGDGIGDACDPDIDNDGVEALGGTDNCPRVPNPGLEDSDGDLQGDACDTDDDGDGIDDILDPCRLDTCDPVVDSNCICDDDPDGDGINTNDDLCPTIDGGPDNLDLNTGLQRDMDGDLIGDPCDPDLDGDGFNNNVDNCRAVFNPDQIDLDRDGLGDGGFVTGPNQNCDTDGECYVVGFGSSSCLDPARAFDVRLDLVPTIIPDQILTGQEVILQLFTNRRDLAHSWEALFIDRPSGSNPSLINALGSGSTPEPFPVVRSCLREENGVCTEFNDIRFTPTQPGRYELKVNVALPNGDPLGLGVDNATATVVLNVDGEPTGGGCNGGGAGALGALAIGLLAFGRRRRWFH